MRIEKRKGITELKIAHLEYLAVVAVSLEVPHLDVLLVFSLSLSLGRLVSLLVVVVDVVGEDLLANLVGTEDRGLAVEDIDLMVARVIEKGTRSVIGSRRGGRERGRVKKKMKNENSLVRAIIL
jgi:hypothetical protein